MTNATQAVLQQPKVGPFDSVNSSLEGTVKNLMSSVSSVSEPSDITSNDTQAESTASASKAEAFAMKTSSDWKEQMEDVITLDSGSSAVIQTWLTT